jgi:predicted NACHT family NTPase
MTEPRWREVFLLAAGMLENADDLMELMQRHSDQLMAADEIQQFLVWLYQKSVSVQVPYKGAAVRAFYLTLNLPDEHQLGRNLSLALAIDLRLADNLAPELSLDLALNRALSLSLALPCDPSLSEILALRFALPHDRNVACNLELQRSLQQLKQQLPGLDQGTENLKEWWNANGQTWVEKLKALILWYRNIGHQWQFNEQHNEALMQYYGAKLLLVDCLKSGCKVTNDMREKIEKRLLLPMKDIERLPLYVCARVAG